MTAEIWAILTGTCWALGSFLEKKGVALGHLSPVMGASLRTAVSVLFLGIFSYPYWHQLKHAGSRSLIMVIIGGGLLSGTLGILFLYQALNSGKLSVVMPLAFCLSPVIGVMLGLVFFHERLTVMQYLGITLTVIGATLTAYFRG
ncbi:EamA family transporter [bacterium]|nr:EamA family transporter [candidate division CSSED10-310 bacterium]